MSICPLLVGLTLVEAVLAMFWMVKLLFFLIVINKYIVKRYFEAM